MLAHAIGKKEVDYTKRVFIQPKFDGVRCYITKDGAFTRTHKHIRSVNHILEQLEPLFKELPHLILDGELYNHSYRDNFEDLVGLIKRQYWNQHSLEIQFHWYDLYNTIGVELDFGDRSLMIKLLQNEYVPINKWVKISPTGQVKSEFQMREFHERLKSEGYEGSIVRLDRPYECKRSHNLCKVKDFMDFEATVISVVEGKGKLQGKLGKFVMIGDNGVEFGAPASGHTHAKRQQMWEDRDNLVGTIWTVECFELTKYGAPRFPVLKTCRDYE